MSQPPHTPHSQDAKYTEFFSSYGGFLAGWAFFDLMIEMLIKRELNLPTRETSIICAGVGFGAKISILLALLARDPKTFEGIKLLRATQQAAERNNFAHGFLSMTQPGDMRLVRREVKNGKYTVRSKPLKIGSHMAGFLKAFEAATKYFKITDDQIDAYSRELESDATLHPNEE